MASLHRQAGFSLLLYVLMVMAMGGLLMEGYLQNARAAAEEQKLLHDQEVLAMAKDALLQYAYNYPEMAGKGPGRLPCADTDNDGQSNTVYGQCDAIGRFPFAEPFLNVFDLRDSSGERLWYAPATTFMTQAPSGIVNSDTVGTITIKDQSGTVIYDGAADGVAAVVIAPGPPIKRAGILQNRTPTNGDVPDDLIADTDLAIIDPTNYLDLNGAQDNATLTHLDSDDGFQLGPVMNAQSEITINDRIMVITSEEILNVARKSVIQTVSRAIGEWQRNIWGANFSQYRMPWLDDFSADPLTENVDTTTGVSGVVLGRLPMLDGQYFAINHFGTSTYDTNKIDGDLRLLYRISGMNSADIPIDLPDAITGAFFKSTGGSPKIEFKATFNLPPSYTFFMVTDDPATPGSTWFLCPDDGNGIQEVTDCSRDSSGVATPGLENEIDSAVRRVTIYFHSHPPVDIEIKQNDYVLPSVSATAVTSLSYIPPSINMDAMIVPALSPAGKNKLVNDLVINSVYEQYSYPAFSSPIGPSLPIPTALIGSSFGVSYFPVLPKWVWNDEDNWYDSVLIAYADGMKPEGSGSCVSGVDCLRVDNISWGKDRLAVLVLAGRSAAGYVNQEDLIQIPMPGGIFDQENADGDNIFDAKVLDGDDMVHILQ